MNVNLRPTKSKYKMKSNYFHFLSNKQDNTTEKLRQLDKNVQVSKDIEDFTKKLKDLDVDVLKILYFV